MADYESVLGDGTAFRAWVQVPNVGHVPFQTHVEQVGQQNLTLRINSVADLFGDGSPVLILHGHIEFANPGTSTYPPESQRHNLTITPASHAVTSSFSVDYDLTDTSPTVTGAATATGGAKRVKGRPKKGR